MKKSYQKLIIFYIILIIILLLNSFILNILGNYYYMDIFLVLLLIIFKLIFGFEKDRHRYIKDIIINMIIIYLISFIIYYIFGIFIGFSKTTNYLTFYGIKTFIFPYIIMIITKEYLRMQMLNKVDKSKILTVITCSLFILLELSPRIASSSINSSYSIFVFLSLTVLPIISSNIVCTYITKKVGYKANIFWLLVANLYSVFIPIVPNVGLYIQSLIEFLFPTILAYNTYSFFLKRAKNIPLSYEKKHIYIDVPIIAVIVLILVYFVSGFFRYYSISIATGSMYPNIKVGDVVVIDQKFEYDDLQIGDVIAYQYNDVIIVHRLYDIVKVDENYYFYTKGDANENKDNYIIYPDTILGKVDLKIPYVGFPTIWLSKLFK